MNALDKLGTPANRALTAYALPIKVHAAQHAAGVLDSIVSDVKFGASASVTADLADVDAVAEWQDARRNWRLDVPDGAIDWARSVWTHAFADELERLAKARAATGESVIREHLQSIGAGR